MTQSELSLKLRTKNTDKISLTKTGCRCSQESEGNEPPVGNSEFEKACTRHYYAKKKGAVELPFFAFLFAVSLEIAPGVLVIRHGHGPVNQMGQLGKRQVGKQAKNQYQVHVVSGK